MKTRRQELIQHVQSTPRIKLLLFSLGASMMLSVILLGARYLYTDRLIYSFLLWNLVLAWVPFIISLIATQIRRINESKSLFWTAVGTWLLFFPNAPYLVTDLIHLRERTLVPLWFDAVLLFFFAWQGIILSFAALSIMQTEFGKRYSERTARLLVIPVLLLTGVGIYVGRFLRWNSWDAVSAPALLLQDLLEVLSNPYRIFHATTFTILLAVFLFVAYVSFRYLVAFLNEQKER